MLERPSSKIVAEVVELLIYWIRERLSIYDLRKSGAPWPWTADELLRDFSWCNARREDDRTTILIRDLWLEPNRENPDVWFLMLIARTLSVDAIKQIRLPLPWSREFYIADMAARKAQELSLEHGAFTVYAVKGYEHKYEGWAHEILDPAWAKREYLRPRRGDTLQSFYERLLEIDGVDTFSAGQIVADVKFIPPLSEASDWETFVAPGPGSGRFLSVATGGTGAQPLKGYAFAQAFAQVRAQVTPRLAVLGVTLSNQNLQNAMCEGFKYWRAKTTKQDPGRHYYPEGAPAAKSRKRKPKAPPPAPAVVKPIEPPPVLPQPIVARVPIPPAPPRDAGPHVLHRDYETRSTLLLNKVGAHRYVADPDTSVLCCAYAVDNEPVRLWIPGDPVPPEFHEAATNPSWTVAAHHDSFESLVEQHILHPRFGWPLIPIERHVCTMATALALSLPAKLESVARALALRHQKDTVGHRLMLMMTKPRKARGDEDPKGTYWFEDPDRLGRLYEYCLADVAAERELFGWLQPLSSSEQSLWVLDAKINARGFAIDRDLAEAAQRIAQAAAPEIDAEIAEVTGGTVTAIHQVARLLGWLQQANGCGIKDLQRKTVETALESEELPANVRRVLELRQDGGLAAVKKIGTLLRCASADDRIRGSLQFHKASTGRWAGTTFQPQNLKRPQVEDLEAAIVAVKTGSYEHVRGLYPRALSLLGDLGRSLIVAAPGHRLIGADFSAVESRVLAWVAGEQWKLDAYARYDATQDPRDEPYCVLACRMLHKPEGTITRESPGRLFGKTGDLACGYMGGAGAIEKFAPGVFSESEREQIKNEWRAAHPNIKKFWYAIDRAAWAAVQTRGSIVPCGPVSFRCVGTFLFLKLPSGRKLAYPLASTRLIDPQRGVVSFHDNAAGRWCDCRDGRGAFGGIWVENVVQAISRDLLADAMQRVEAAGFPIVLHVHDELVAEVPEGFGSAEEFTHLMTRKPAWALTLPIAAKAWSGPRFS